MLNVVKLSVLAPAYDTYAEVQIYNLIHFIILFLPIPDLNSDIQKANLILKVATINFNWKEILFFLLAISLEDFMDWLKSS
jgi:hypothetical protein